MIAIHSHFERHVAYSLHPLEPSITSIDQNIAIVDWTLATLVYTRRVVCRRDAQVSRLLPFLSSCQVLTLMNHSS